MQLRRILSIILALALIAAAILFRVPLLDLGRAACTAAGDLITAISHRPPASSETLVASGMIEARALDIASPTGGRVAGLYVVAGQAVAAGDLVAELDTSLLDAQIAEARAAVAVAEARVALLRAGPRAADLAVARAAVGQAGAARAAADTAWQDALALMDAPGELDVQIAQATAALQVATEQAAAAEASASAADLEEQMWGRVLRSLEAGIEVPLPIPGGGSTRIDAPPERLAYASLQWNLASQRTWAAHAHRATALAARDAAQGTLADLRSQRAEPLALTGQAEIAAAQHELAAAAVTAAQAQVALLEAGTTAEELAAAEKWVTQAQAAVAALETRRAQARVTAPEAGVITAIITRAGEVAVPAAAIVRLADLTEVTLTVYVPAPRLGEVAPGQAVQIRVDSFPDRVFPGTVTHIASRAEFTPRNVQTREERATTVFAMKITASNPDAALKPGMPADAYFTSEPLESGRRSLLRDDPTTGSRSLLRNIPQLATGASPDGRGVVRYSGAIEATEARVASELGGRVVRTHAIEGDGVTAGQALVELDGEELAARCDQAEAALAAARAELARVAAPPQPARIAQAQAGVSQMEAALAVAQAGLDAARAQRDQPQALDAQINAARGQVRTATAAIDAAQAELKAAQVLQGSLQSPGSDEEHTRRAMYDQQVAAAEALVRAAQAQERGARAVLVQLLAIREQPVAAQAAVHRAQGEVAKAQAALVTAQAVLEQTRAPAPPQAIAVALAQIAQAEAALAVLDVTAAKLTVRSPLTGTLALQAIRTGEIAQPAAPLFTVVDLRQVKLVIYVPTGQIGEVRLGQDAEVFVDAYPGRVFAGRVARIADQAEFTPKNVQTQEERVKTVFAVEIALENEAELLRPGMPAEASLQ